MFRKRDHQGHLVKREFGPRVFSVFRVLRRLKFLRGTAFDVFGKTQERRMERQLIADYFAKIESLRAGIPAAHLTVAMEKQAALLARWHDPMAAIQAA